MAAAVDYNALRAQTLGSGVDEEAVTVNTRALIDKVLARYSGEWTVLRELLQNAADATASKVVIRLETLPSAKVPVPSSSSSDPSAALKHVLLHHTLGRLLVTNNGHPFASSDWSRLKRIAEGNPDETKIGAFGVGFYSVFADCEEPFVSSGREAMAFYWKGNSLFTRRSKLPNSHTSNDTTFVLEYRNTTSPVPRLLPLCQFLSTSLTFVGLQGIELWVDDWNILSLSKKAAPGAHVQLPNDVEMSTKENMMKVIAVERETVQMDANCMDIAFWTPPAGSQVFATSTSGSELGVSQNPGSSIRSFFSRLSAPAAVKERASAREGSNTLPEVVEDLTNISTNVVFLRISTATIQTSISAAFGKELERATKKPAPRRFNVAILTSSRQEVAASTASNPTSVARKGGVFASVLPSTAGKVFIGFPTHQTTGLLAHISAHSVIPTVERESMDLNARYVRTWNIELLRAAGIVARIIWASDMSEIRDGVGRAVQAAGRNKILKEDVARFLPDAVHVFRQFTFRESTPAYQVGQIVQESFWTSNKNASIELFSSQGVLPSQDVRLATEDLSGFVQGIPVLPDELVTGAPEFVRTIKEYGLVTDITVADVRKELGTKALNETQLGEFLKWAGRKASTGQVDAATIHSLLDVVVATVEADSGNNTGGVVVLGEVECYVNPSRVPVDMPVPPNTAPFSITKNISRSDLEALGWVELQIVPWLRYLVEMGKGSLGPDHDITANPKFSAQVLPVLSRQWDSLSQGSKSTVVGLLQTRTVMPTKMGMKKPPDAYFTSVKLFDDLPIITGLANTKDKFLLALGVRRTVALSVVFERLMDETAEKNATGTAAKWSHADLIRYLASVRDDIPAEDIARLKERAICPAEEAGDKNTATSRRYKVSQLYEPKDELRRLRLRILQWPGVYRPGSSEARFLGSVLGLKSIPSVEELLDIMSTAPTKGDMALRDEAMKYFITNYHSHNYGKTDLARMPQAYLPLHGDGKKLVPAAACFTNPKAAVLGFSILRNDLQPDAAKFGVRPDPPMADCVNRLIQSPPSNRREAMVVFEYFSSRLGELGRSQIDALTSALIIPVLKKAAEKQISSSQGSATDSYRHVSPSMCFLGDNSIYEKIFDFVDFGHEGNAFLLKCGSKHEPSKREIAAMVAKEPARILGIVQKAEVYLDLLRSLADGYASLKTDKVLLKDLKRAPFLLAYKEIPADRSEEKAGALISLDDTDEDSEETGIKEWSLASAAEIVLVDDVISYNHFKQHLRAAPQDETLEKFYSLLGSPVLSNVIEEVPRTGAVTQDQSSAQKLRKLILERSKLFLHDVSQDAIRHDGRWLEKNLQVINVQSISLRRVLRGPNLTHTESRSAVLVEDKRQGCRLLVTSSGFDYFQVSQALVTLLLRLPRPQSAMMLEMLLGSDILKLRARGYNVDRILRAKAAEQRLAEGQRQTQLEAEKRKAKEEELAWAGAQDRRSKDLAMPGAFNDSPEHVNGSASVGPSRHSPVSFLSSIQRRLGLEEGAAKAQQQLQKLTGQGQQGQLPSTEPPPYTPEEPRDPKGPGGGGVGPVSSPHALQSSLLKAISASRAHDASSLFSRPQINNIREPSSYCDERPGQNMSLVATTDRNIKIYVAKSTRDGAGFVRSNATRLNAFVKVLDECADIFKLPPSTLNIFYDPASSSIAFNAQGSLFCNYLFFEQLHWPAFAAAEDNTIAARTEALVYWWVTLCHELAHNLVEDHSSAHSYWTENFVAQYFVKVTLKISTYHKLGAKTKIEATGLQVVDVRERPS
ncbi:MAG: hypothetical protein M1825_003914 [Sarcosagium campestre]|nr:MAG: hypothetical protein M1825_003914 [Sarcosagium campestre]